MNFTYNLFHLDTKEPTIYQWKGTTYEQWIIYFVVAI